VTYCLEGSCSIQLSYQVIFLTRCKNNAFFQKEKNYLFFLSKFAKK